MAGRRPTSLAEFEALTGFMTDESFRIGTAYRPDPPDIFVSPYSKCGTTWMQQIVHSLRSGGSMDFEEITQVVPWLELAHDLGIDVNAPQVAEPRVFKSHLRWDDIPKGGRYIVVLRDPVDAMVSLFRFMDGWFFESGSVSVEEFNGYYLTRGDESYWAHAASWWRQRDRDDVLLLNFERMKTELPAIVDQVADFMDQGYTPERRALALDQASFASMKANASKYDDSLVHRARDAACGLPPDGLSTKVDKGKSGVVVSDEIRTALDAQWQATMGQEFGLPSYSALRDALNKGQ